MTMTNSSDIGLTCDVCGRTVQGATFVNGMKFCAKCYQETFGNNYCPSVVENIQNKLLLKENAQLKEEIEILHKALELADRQLYGMSSDDLIEQAKEMLNDKKGKTIKK